MGTWTGAWDGWAGQVFGSLGGALVGAAGSIAVSVWVLRKTIANERESTAEQLSEQRKLLMEAAESERDADRLIRATEFVTGALEKAMRYLVTYGGEFYTNELALIAAVARCRAELGGKHQAFGNAIRDYVAELIRIRHQPTNDFGEALVPDAPRRAQELLAKFQELAIVWIAVDDPAGRTSTLSSMQLITVEVSRLVPRDQVA